MHARTAAESLRQLVLVLLIAFATVVVVGTAVGVLLPEAPMEFRQLGPERLT